MSFKKMLSFERGEPIAHGLDKNGKRVLTINLTDEQSEPDIMADHIENTIDEDDIKAVSKILRLLPIETKQLRKFIDDVRGISRIRSDASGSRSGLTEDDKQILFDKLTDRIQLAVTEIRKRAKNIL